MQIQDNSTITTQSVAECLLCHQKSETLAHLNCIDVWFQSPGKWSYSTCKECETLWLNPRPISQDIPKLYQNYYTHSSPRNKKSLFKNALIDFGFQYPSRLKPSVIQQLLLTGLIFLRPIYDYAGGKICWLPFLKKGARLLDVGCGNGEFLLEMQKRGWVTIGTESDPKAVALCKENQIEVHNKELQDLTLSEPLTAITLSHVIEHVENPHLVLNKAYSLLEKDGLLFIITPNIKSLGHYFFKSKWRGLEPPRHFNLFSPRSLEALIKKSGFEIVFARSTSKAARFYCQQSSRLPKWVCICFQIIEHFVELFFPVGEEIIVLAKKPNT